MDFLTPSLMFSDVPHLVSQIITLTIPCNNFMIYPYTYVLFVSV